MTHIGIVSYNIYGNFTNYGSALQSWALHQVINKLGGKQYDSVLVDYCPMVHLDKDILNPMKHMWDQDSVSQRACELSLIDIRENYYKFNSFFHNRFKKTESQYNYENFETIIEKDHIAKFVCGSDTIFCTIESHGFDDGFFANYPCMKGNSIAYAASFGDTYFDEDSYLVLNQRLHNFQSLGIREKKFVSYIHANTEIPCQKTIDPTLLLTSEEYGSITSERISQEKYLVLYARRYNPKMFDFADRLAKEHGWKVVDISLRAQLLNGKHDPWYKAGVEEFLSLVKHAEFIVTNSFHGLIFSVQFCKPIVVFSREQADSKIEELLDLFGMNNQMLITGAEDYESHIDYESVHKRIAIAREESITFLKQSLERLLQ